MDQGYAQLDIQTIQICPHCKNNSIMHNQGMNQSRHGSPPRIGRNLRTLMDQQGLSETALARAAGVPQPTVHRLVNTNTHDPRDSTLRPLADYFGVTVEQLRTKLPAPLPRPPAFPKKRIPGYEIKAIDGSDGLDLDAEVLVAEVDVMVSGGHGAVVPEFVETRYRMSYQISWLRQVGANPNDVRLMKVTGNSMERTLFHGDRIAVNIADRRIVDGRVYVFATGGTDPDIKVKRLYRTIDGRLRITSDNMDKMQYPDEYLSPEEAEQLTIIGRVIDRSGQGGL
jgi:transcriptional regulator with XRE-family HTH domain